ncbi:hypothetical protein [Streptomyces sp. NPDC048410]|uniref:hypothetical protein n=1 Tax=Streptomyces sp. NPDC048410 TaxID=3365545 RepID=UPI00370FBE02
MVTSEIVRGGDLQAVLAAVTDRDMLVVAPNSTVNTGIVTGDQRQIVSAAPEGGPGAGPMRQGPVRAAYLKTARRRFVPPPGFEGARAALDSPITVLVGEPGSGRETHALNLLAHGSEDPVLVQIDGGVHLTRWKPRARGVDGYLVMEPPDPLALRAWDLSRLEASLAEAGARLIIVLADAPALAGALEDHLGVPVLRHHPPDPQKVFAAHLSDGCSCDETRAQWLSALRSSRLDELLRAGLPPRHAAHAARVVAQSSITGDSEAEVIRRLTRSEGAQIVARAQADPSLLSYLLSLNVYGGLDRSVVAEQAGNLLRLMVATEVEEPVGPSPHGHPAGAACQRPLSETLRILGAHRTQCAGEGATDTVSFLWPAVSEVVWEVICRDHTDLLPLLHTWLAGPEDEADQIERAGRAVAAMAVATGGRSMELLHGLATAPSPQAPQVAAWCLGTVAQNPDTAKAAAAAQLEQWSGSAEAPLRKAVAYTCRADRSQLTDEAALRLLQRLMETLSGDADGLSVVDIITTALVQRFEAGDSSSRAAVLRRMRDWTQCDGVPDLLTALTFPVMASVDLAWWSEEILTDAELASCAVELIGHALNESCTFAVMRDALLVWCSEAGGAEHRAEALSELLTGLVTARQPGFLRWLLAVERGPDTLPGKQTAAQALVAWRNNTPVPQAD